ncbi:hypothetical protein ACFLYK_02050 [Candidatus Cloacimonadota bacterium]
MKNRTKKLKAAIMGVIAYLQQEEQDKNKVARSTWSRSSRETIMQNRRAIQTRSFGLGWHRK